VQSEIPEVEKTLGEREEDGKDLEDQIKKLKVEINKLPKTAAKKAAG
jgi:septal ring factor EnvC (AmiA/AmiB activator)